MNPRPVLLALTLASFSPSALAATAPANPTTGTNLSESRLRWNLKTLVGDYDRVGKRDAKWDREARAALEAYARIRANPTGELSSLILVVSNSAEKAVSAGCIDPMVAYLRVRYIDRMKATDAESAELHRQAAKGLAASGYHNLRKAYATLNTVHAYKHMADSPTNLPPAVNVYRGRLRTNVVDTVQDASVPGDEIYELCMSALEQLAQNAYLVEGWFAVIEPLLLKHWPEDYRLYLMKGSLHVPYAWSARGGGYANTVSEANFKLFHDRLSVAAEALRRAWKLNSQDPKIPTEMLRVELGLGQGRDEMEKWFQRAMALDPANYAACGHKMNYLEPKWYGSEEDMLAFGRECVTSRKWKGSVPLTLAEAHDALARYLPKEKRDQYWKRPNVWKDIRDAFESYFSRPDADQSWRHNYVRYAYWCGQWKPFQEQLPKMGWTNYTYFGGKEAFDRMVRTAQENLTKARE
jgi:hypothetical protein